MRVLIVDDNPDERKIFVTTLYYNGFEAFEAGTGMEGINAARHYRPDLIVMDIKLPDMNGFLATEIIRTEPGLENVPVICVTGMDMDVDNALSRGCTDFLQKPFAPIALLQAVRRNIATPPVS